MCISLLLFAASYAIFPFVPKRAQVPNAGPTLHNGRDTIFQISRINASDISELSEPLRQTTIGTLNSVLQANSSDYSSSFRLDLTFIASCVAYALVSWSGMCARGIIDSIIFAVALAAHMAGSRLYGFAHATGALSSMVFSILYGCILNRWQTAGKQTGSRQLSGNESGLVSRSEMVSVWNNSRMGAVENSVTNIVTETNSNYMLRFSIVIAIGCALLLLNVLSVSFYRTAPRKKQKSVLRDVWNATRNAHVYSIFVVIFVTGLFSHAYDGLFYWYIQDLGGSVFFVGLILALRNVAEIVGNLVGPVIVARTGPQPAFLYVFAAHVLRFASLAALPYTAHIHVSLGPLGPMRPAYWTLPIETLQAITFSLDRLLYSSVLSAHSPASSISSLVAFGQSVQLGLGYGLIGLSQGVAYSTIGPQAFYALLTIVALSAGVLYAVFQFCVLRCLARPQKKRDTELVAMENGTDELKAFVVATTYRT